MLLPTFAEVTGPVSTPQASLAARVVDDVVLPWLARNFMQATERAAPDNSNASVARLLVRNTLYLTAAQILTIPLSMLTNALTARFLGPVDFGHIYLAGTICGFGILAVEWGQQGVLPASIARDHAQAPSLVGTSLMWRFALAFVAYPVLAIGSHLFGLSAGLQWALGLTFLAAMVSSYCSAFKDTIRGFERTDIPAYTQVGQQFLVVMFTAPVLFAGARLRGALLAQVAAGLVVMFVLWRSLRLVGVRKLSVDRSALRALLREGTPFVFFGVAMALQPIIDALWLARAAPEKVMGWLAVSQRLIGVLLFPASALLGALYPTLSRLFTTDMDAFVRTARGALHTVALAVVPVALGCGLYPDIGIAIFDRNKYGPAEDILRIRALFLFLVYFTMPLGICILAAGKRRAWSIVQSLCIAVSLIFDPILLPWFQTRYGNGALGLAIAGVFSEVLVVACGVVLAPKGIFDRRFAKSLALAVLSGAAMAFAAWLMKPITPFIAAPLAVIVYCVALVVTGGIEKVHVNAARSMIQRKLSRPR